MQNGGSQPVFNAQRLWRKHDLVVHDLTIARPAVKAIMHSNGQPNWNIVRASQSAKSEKDSARFEIKTILIKKFVLDDARVAYHDFVTRTFAEIEHFDLSLKAKDLDEKLVPDTEMHSKGIHFPKDGYVFAKKFNADLSTSKPDLN